jgi:U4/U6.U5 tri-snRNP-associated protein 2
MDLPPAPLYLDERSQNIIPQVPLGVLLNKFNGKSEKVSNVTNKMNYLFTFYNYFQEYKTYKDNFIKRFELLHLPEFLIITYNRFHKNQWFVEKNPTIVNFPIT